MIASFSLYSFESVCLLLWNGQLSSKSRFYCIYNNFFCIHFSITSINWINLFDSIVIFVSKLIQSTFEQIACTILTDPKNGEPLTSWGKHLRLQEYEILICVYIDNSPLLTTGVSLENILPIFTSNNLPLCFSFVKSAFLDLCLLYWTSSWLLL